MLKPSPSLLALSIVSSLAALGCTEDPPTPTELRGQISSDLGTVLREADAAITGGTDALPGSAALAMVDRVLGTDTQLGQQLRALTAPLVAQGAGVLPADYANHPNHANAIDADAQVAYLNDKLFNDANHVGDGIYQVPASLVCERTTFDANGTATQTIDAMCAQQLAKAELRIRTAREDGALVFAIQLDADHDEPLRLTLTHSSIALTADLDGTQRAFVALAGVFGQDVPNAALAGQVTGKLEILGTAKLKASVAIDRALSIKLAKAGADLGGADAFVLASAKAEAFSVTLDGAGKTASLAVGLGETAVKLPAIDPGKRFELDLPGVTATASFTAGQPLQLTHLGLGKRTTTISINGVPAQTIDLNAQDGRAFDATVSHDAATATDTLAITPKLDLQMTVNHAVLGDDQPVYDVTRVQLAGSLRGSDTTNQIAVSTGSFSITTNPAGHGFTASAGQCVADTSALDPTTGASFTQWTVGACR
jgi:hypothetical protein